MRTFLILVFEWSGFGMVGAIARVMVPTIQHSEKQVGRHFGWT